MIRRSAAWSASWRSTAPDFRCLWARNRVHQRSAGTKSYRHPLVGELTITYQALTPGDDPEQTVFVYRAETVSPSEHALRLLASAPTASAPAGADRRISPSSAP